MKARTLLTTAALSALWLWQPAWAQGGADPIVRLAELEIAPAHLAAFTQAAQANVRASLRDEPGVLAMVAVADKAEPTRVSVLEMYADTAAYEAHLRAPHFRQFRATTDAMMTARRLIETEPVMLGAKPALPAHPLARLAQLTIDPAQLDAYKAAVREEIDASIRLEPGVLAIYAVAVKGQPHQLRFVELYADEAAYQRHRDSPHFQTYLVRTQPMITKRVLTEAEPVALGAKPR